MKSTELSLICVRLCQYCLAVLALVACSSDREDFTDEAGRDKGTYFQLSICTEAGRQTRAAGPAGGEAGDGSLTARGKENVAYNATVLLYHSEKGMNATAAEAQNIKIEYAFYSPTLDYVVVDGVGMYRSPLLHDPGYVQSGTYHLLVLVNMGDMTCLKGKSLYQVRDLTTRSNVRSSDGSSYTGGSPEHLSDVTMLQLGSSLPGLPWSGSGMNVGTYDYFYMTSSDDLSLTFGSLSGPDNPVRIQADVSRLAARIDFSPGNTGEYTTTELTFTPTGESSVTLNSYYKYAVKNAGGTATGDYYYLVGWCPINLRQDECYLFRRVSDYADGTHLDYLGKERAVDIGTASEPGLMQQVNYVLDPLTAQKTSLLSGLDYAAVYNKYYDGSTTPLPAASEFQLRHDGELDMEEDGRRYHVLAYAMENTQRSDSPKERFATGIILKGYYAKKGAGGDYTYTAKNYVYYIRHSDPTNSNSDALVMKYGIVRNNVYRIYINKVSPTGLILIETMNWLNVRADEIYM